MTEPTAFGPIELLVVRFPGTQITDEIVGAMRDLIDSGTVRIVDLLVVRKDAEGNATWSEPSAIGDALGLDGFVSDMHALLSEEDVDWLTTLMANDSAAGLVLFENTWATRFADAIVRANGEVLLNERIPRAVIEELMAPFADEEVEVRP